MEVTIELNNIYDKDVVAYFRQNYDQVIPITIGDEVHSFTVSEFNTGYGSYGGYCHTSLQLTKLYNVKSVEEVAAENAIKKAEEALKAAKDSLEAIKKAK